jgi:hypothetical protein
MVAKGILKNFLWNIEPSKISALVSNFLTGPSGVGKTDASFSLLMKLKNSVYLDADWFCAKNPLDPLSLENIEDYGGGSVAGTR